MINLLYSNFLVFEERRSLIDGGPDTRHLCNWTIGGTLELVYIVVEFVGPEREIGLINFDGELDLTENLVVK
jgi:hypothetical protein